MTLYVGGSKILEKGTAISGIYYGSTPIKKIYNGSQLVYNYIQNPYNPNEVLIEQQCTDTATDLTWSKTLYPGTYELTLVGSGANCTNGYYYHPAGHCGDTLVCRFKLTSVATVSATVGHAIEGSQLDSHEGRPSYFYINGTQAVKVGGGRNNGIAINSSAINITSTSISDSTGGSNAEGSGENPGALKNGWGDGGYTNSALGRGGGVKVKLISFN